MDGEPVGAGVVIKKLKLVRETIRVSTRLRVGAVVAPTGGQSNGSGSCECPDGGASTDGKTKRI